MLQHCLRPPTCLWSSTRLASQFSQSPTDGRCSSVKVTAVTPNVARSGPSSIISRLSERTQSSIRRSTPLEQETQSLDVHVDIAADAHRKPRLRATTFVSSRSAQKRDHAAEKWFTNVRELDIVGVDQPNDLQSLLRKKRTRSGSPKQHEMRPRTDLNALFAPSTARSAASSRLQSKRELGGDYASYLPGGYADPHRFPVDYARLVLGRNKHIPLNKQTGALNLIEETIQGRTTGQVA